MDNYQVKKRVVIELGLHRQLKCPIDDVIKAIDQIINIFALPDNRGMPNFKCMAKQISDIDAMFSGIEEVEKFINTNLQESKDYEAQAVKAIEGGYFTAWLHDHFRRFNNRMDSNGILINILKQKSTKKSAVNN